MPGGRWKLLPNAKTQLVTYFKSTEASILRSSRSGPVKKLDEGPETHRSDDRHWNSSKSSMPLQVQTSWQLQGQGYGCAKSFCIPQSGQSCNFSYEVHSLEIFMAKKESSQKASHQENNKPCITPEKKGCCTKATLTNYLQSWSIQKLARLEFRKSAIVQWHIMSRVNCAIGHLRQTCNKLMRPSTTPKDYKILQRAIRQNKASG